MNEPDRESRAGLMPAAKHATATTGEKAITHENPQPNLQELTVPLRLWPAILLTGAGAGLLSGLLMRLLRLVQPACFHYHEGDFLSGVEGVSGSRRVIVVACAGVFAGI